VHPDTKVSHKLQQRNTTGKVSAFDVLLGYSFIFCLLFSTPTHAANKQERIKCDFTRNK